MPITANFRIPTVVMNSCGFVKFVSKIVDSVPVLIRETRAANGVL